MVRPEPTGVLIHRSMLAGSMLMAGFTQDASYLAGALGMCRSRVQNQTRVSFRQPTLVTVPVTAGFRQLHAIVITSEPCLGLAGNMSFRRAN